MYYLYKYIDIKDEKVKYIGITNNLPARVVGHKTDSWNGNSEWRIEYIDDEIKTKNDAEMLEGHFIAKYGTYKYYNTQKIWWGISSYAEGKKFNWKIYKYSSNEVEQVIGDIKQKEKQIKELEKEIEVLSEEIKSSNKKNDYDIPQGVLSFFKLMKKENKNEHFERVIFYNMYCQYCKDNNNENIYSKYKFNYFCRKYGFKEKRNTSGKRFFIV